MFEELFRANHDSSVDASTSSLLCMENIYQEPLSKAETWFCGVSGVGCKTRGYRALRHTNRIVNDYLEGLMNRASGSNRLF